jgi:hypothetical protein
VVNNHAIAGFETAATLTGCDNLAAWFVACDYSLVTFRPLAEMLVIDAANIRAADGRSFHAQQDFPVAWGRHGDSAQLDG